MCIRDRIKDGAELTTIELDEGEKIPKDLSKFDAMFCMGGPMDTWMEKEHPWLIDEKKRIKEFVVDLKKPYLGFCLGCQLLGEVTGGKVVKTKNPEIGIYQQFGTAETPRNLNQATLGGNTGMVRITMAGPFIWKRAVSIKTNAQSFGFRFPQFAAEKRREFMFR